MAPRGAPSLYDAAKRQALRAMRTTEDLGEMPFKVAEPLLKKVQTAAQLERLERNSPQFVGETRNIWINLIKRDLPSWDGTEPQNPASWHKLYQKLVRAEARATEEDALILKAKMEMLAAEKGDRQIHTTNLLHKSKVRGTRSTLPSQPINQSSLRFNGGSRTKMVTGKDVLARAKREARERSKALNNTSILARPTHTLNQRASVVRAPAGLVQQHQQEKVRVQTTRPPQARAIDQVRTNKLSNTADREARLRAIKAEQGHPQNMNPTTARRPGGSILLSSEAGERSKRKLDDLDDLFGESDEEEQQFNSPPSKRPHLTTGKSPASKPAADIFLRKPVRRPVR